MHIYIYIYMNFNPENYTLNEIANFFDLQPNHTFDQINTSFRNKHNEVTLTTNLSHEQKDEMTSFFEQLKNKLVLHLSTSDVPHNSFNRGPVSNRLTEKIDDHVDTVTNNAIIYPTTTNKVISAGIMNPIERNILTNIIHFDTRFKQNYVIESTSDKCKNTKFTFNMPTSFKNVVSMSLLSFEAPTETIYNITEQLGNNTFSMSFSTGGFQEITIGSGHYSIAQLCTEIKNKINVKFSASMTVDIRGNGEKSGKIEFIESTPTGFSLKFPEIRGKLNLGYLLGFRTYNEIESAIVGSSQKITGTALTEVIDETYYYLSFNDYQRSVNQNNFAILNKNFVTKNIIAKLVDREANDNDIRIITVPKKFFGPVSLDRVTFELLDKYGNSVDLSGANYSFTIQLDILYKF
jgi:hypothetical protein